MFARLGVATAFAAVLVTPAPAFASINDGLQAMREMNLIVLGNLSSQSLVEGRTFVGGNLSGPSSNYFQLNGKAAAASDWPGLTVVGNVTGGAKNLSNGSGAFVGGNLDSGFNLNGGAQIVKIGGNAKSINASTGAKIAISGNAQSINSNGAASLTIGGNARDINGSRGQTIDVGGSKSGYFNANDAIVRFGVSTPDVFATPLAAQAASYIGDLRALSGYLAGLGSANGSINIASNRATFTAAPSSALSVFNLTSDDLGRFGEIQFNLNGADTVIINVSGKTILLDDNFLGNSNGLGEHVIWNFQDATSLTLTAGFYGSILAPDADAVIRSQMQGSGVFGSLDQAAAVQLGGFKGSYSVQPDGPVSAVPEPAVWFQMILGFGMIGLGLRSRLRRMQAA